MEPDTLNGRFEFGLKLIADAGALALSYFNSRDRLTIASKGLQDMASEADVNTEMLIRERLATAYPGDAFLGEETGISDYAPHQGIWVVDPIDGTQPFISGLTSWCVSIGFLQEGVIQFGMVYAPARNELFAGCVGHAATLNGKPISPSRAQSVRDGMVGAGYSPRSGPARFLPAFTRLLEAGGIFAREGSGALALCYVACGRLIGYFETHINSWDCLGAIAVLNAAGARTSDFLAGDGLRNGNPIIAGNEAVFRQLTEFRGA